MLYQDLLAVAKTLVCHQHVLANNAKHSPVRLLWGKVTPLQPYPMHFTLLTVGVDSLSALFPPEIFPCQNWD